MNEKQILLDPTSERTPQKRDRLPRPKSLKNLTVGLLDISKARGSVLLDHLESILIRKGMQVKRYRKPTFARVAPIETKQAISTECDVVIEALAD
ncbi:MAG: hypothetical protein HQM13_00375 [SAR324 cluster bacterium]|nr:hypothetical protein [SAR324 cluster bacterium]